VLWRVKNGREKISVYSKKIAPAARKERKNHGLVSRHLWVFSRLRREGNIGNSGLLFADKFTFTFSPSGISVYFST